VKTSGEEFFSCRVIGRFVCSSKIHQLMHSDCDCSFYPLFVSPHHGHLISPNPDILSRPSLNELFSRGTEHRTFLSDLSIEEAIEKGLEGGTYCLTMLHSSSQSSFAVPSVDVDHLKRFQCSFVMTSVGKCSYNFFCL
jgi:hypothetical protein